MDEMNFELKIDLHGNQTTLKFLSVAVFLDVSIDNLCFFQIPTVLLLKKTQINYNLLTGMELNFEGSLNIHQNRALQCPFFLRKIKTHFDHRLIKDNMTTIDNFSYQSIRSRLTRNPTFFKYDSIEEEITYNNNAELTINLKLHIQEVFTRYNFTLWQRLNKIWVQYLSIFVIFYLLTEKMKSFMFSYQYLCAWEVEPWQKLK